MTSTNASHGIIQDSLTINRIHDVVDKIRQALENEYDELDAEIQLLQSTMDVESDMLSRMSTPQSRGCGSTCSREGMDTSTSAASLRNTLCTDCGARLDVLGCGGGGGRSVYCGPGRVRPVNGSLPSGTTRADKMWSENRGGLCVTCEIHRSAAWEMKESRSGRSFFSHEENGGTLGCDAIRRGPDGQGGAPVEEVPKTARRPGTSGGGRSRVRSRIESARDERFFLDEDPFLN